MMRTPCTRASGLGVFTVTGSKRLPKPAASSTARSTRYGSSALAPASVNAPSRTRPRSSKAASATVRASGSIASG